MSAERGGAEPPELNSAPSRPYRDLDRVAELELRLRRIAAEVRAAGIAYTKEPAVDLHEFPGFGDLTTRQWEVLHRLLEGERVPSIASELYISRSTVRNHLAAIFQKFGVHTQAELIELFQRARV